MNKKVVGISILVFLILATIFMFSFFNHTILTRENPKLNSSISSDLTIVNANNQFAFDLYKLYSSSFGNVLFSPYSISSALAMVYEGAEGNTAKEMKNVLHFPEDKNTIREGFYYLNSKMNINKFYNLTLANSLWIQEDYKINQTYLDVIQSYYEGKTSNLNFIKDAETSRVIINSWVEGKTNNKIQNIIPPGIVTSDTRLVLVNAIYFYGNWSDEFDSFSTYNDSFLIDDSTNVSVKFMHKTSDFDYYESDSFQALGMDYRGYDLSMLILLPKSNNISSFENSLDSDLINQVNNKLSSKEVRVSFPRFKFSSQHSMKDDLSSLGMSDAFSSNADFTGINSGGLAISDVLHKAFIEVTESGTEAAAATAVIAVATGIPSGSIQEPKIFKADHPFIFIIQQKGSGNILFLGRVSNPSLN